MRKLLFLLVALAIFSGYAEAKVDLVTLPDRDEAQITIYNSADLTLVREKRSLTLMKGINKLQFSWAGTLIDPTSLELEPKGASEDVLIQAIIYPPRTRNLGVWRIESGLSGKSPFEISYLTSGLSWRAFYMGTLTPDENFMNLQGYVRVNNQSGEDYQNVQTRLIVGRINLIDRIAELARREYPYGRPVEPLPPPPAPAPMVEEAPVMLKKAMEGEEFAMMDRVKEIKKEALSEYFLYTIEGREDIPNGWSKRLPSFTADKVPVLNLYKYEEEKYGGNVFRFLSFKNDKEHKLGDTPIPGGDLKVYRTIDAGGELSYQGASSFKYIPLGEDVELNLGPVNNVIVEPVMMEFRTDHYMFDNDGNIAGWDEIRNYKVEVKNTRDIPVKVEIKRNFETKSWEATHKGEGVAYEKVDINTVKFTLRLDGRSDNTFHYEIVSHHGTRAE